MALGELESSAGHSRSAPQWSLKSSLDAAHNQQATQGPTCTSTTCETLTYSAAQTLLVL